MCVTLPLSLCNQKSAWEWVRALFKQDKAAFKKVCLWAISFVCVMLVVLYVVAGSNGVVAALGILGAFVFDLLMRKLQPIFDCFLCSEGPLKSKGATHKKANSISKGP